MDEKTKRKGRPSRWKWIIFGIMCVIFAIVCGCGIYIRALVGTLDMFGVGSCISEEPFDYEEINRMANLTLPPSTSNFEAYSVAWQDCAIYLKFSIDAEDAEAFYASTQIQDFVKKKGNEFSMYAPNTDTIIWAIDAKTEYMYGYADENRETQEIAIDISNPETYVVYVTVNLL